MLRFEKGLSLELIFITTKLNPYKVKLLKQFIKKYFQNFSYFYRYLGYRVFLVMILSILVGLLDGMGLTMFLPLLQMADGQSSVSPESLGNLGFLVRELNEFGIQLNLVNALIFLLFFFVLKGFATYFSVFYKVLVRQYFVRTLRLKLINYFTRYSYKSFVLSDVGRIQNTLTGEVAKVSIAYISYFSCFQNTILLLVYMSFAFMVDWKFALLTSVGGALTNLIYKTIYNKTKEESASLTKNNSDFQGLVIQFIANFKYLKATGSLNRYVGIMENSVKDVEANNTKIGVLESKITASREPLLMVVIVGVILLQVYGMNGSLSSILVSLLFFYRALTSLMSIQTNYNGFLGVSGSLDNMTEFEKELKAGIENDGPKTIKAINGEIKIIDVSFGFNENNLILDKINLSIKKDQTIAFVGDSGSGKTTLVSIISGLMKPDAGSVEIDGNNINDIKVSDYQRKIGYISQDPVIFNDTIYNNVTFWSEKTPENILLFNKAIAQASISDFIQELPNQENTILGNNGINLSGGQKQRISIARELFKEIDLLILDEATSALDSENEKNIQQNIDALKGNYTIIIIAHRLSTVKNADMIVVMNKGQIISKGNFENLLIESDKFKKMVEIQNLSNSNI